jgi:large subunit ribosomal protein L9
MQVILLERILKLGQMGDVVTVKDGFARNYLLPQGKALRANKANLARFEAERAQIEATNLERQKEAEAVHEKLNGTRYVMVRSAGETGQLYGSVSTRDIAESMAEQGFKVARNQILLQNPIKVIGMHEIDIQLHSEVFSKITINVARSEDEAERQASGEDLTAREGGFERETYPEDADIDLEEIFENPDEAELAADEAEESAAEAKVAEEEAEEKPTS